MTSGGPRRASLRWGETGGGKGRGGQGLWSDNLERVRVSGLRFRQEFMGGMVTRGGPCPPGRFEAAVCHPTTRHPASASAPHLR